MGRNGCTRSEGVTGKGVRVELHTPCLRDKNCPSVVLKKAHPRNFNYRSGQRRYCLDARWIPTEAWDKPGFETKLCSLEFTSNK